MKYIQIVLETVQELAVASEQGDSLTSLEPIYVIEALYDRYRYVGMRSSTLINANAKEFGFLSTCDTNNAFDKDVTLATYRLRAYKIATLFQTIASQSVRSIYVVSWIEQMLLQLLGSSEYILPYLNAVKDCIH